MDRGTELVIETTKLSCKSGRRYLIKDIDWQVNRGEHWVVFGMNGSGKTTLLSAIAGFKQPTHGELRVFGHSFTKDNILEIRRRIGWVSSSFFDRYYTKESALDIVLSGKFGTLGISDAVYDGDIKRAKALLKELHLGDKISRPFHMMSKGERQNVLIARALFFNPDILVLDEPCTGLDVLAREHLQNTVQDLAKNTEVSIIYVTHYTEEILDIFTKALLLRQGCVYAQGKREAIFTEEIMGDFLGHSVTLSKRSTQGLEMGVAVQSQVRNLLGRSEFQ